MRTICACDLDFLKRCNLVIFESNHKFLWEHPSSDPECTLLSFVREVRACVLSNRGFSSATEEESNLPVKNIADGMVHIRASTDNYVNQLRAHKIDIHGMCWVCALTNSHNIQ